MKYFAGIGSRETPPEILEKMREIAGGFTAKGYILRSGGAKGADTAFEKGVAENRAEIFHSQDATSEAIDLAMKYHPNPNALKSKGPYVVGLMGRNMQILLGRELNTPVEFVVCWTKEGKVVGGTGQALRASEDLEIPVYNLALEKDLLALRERYEKEFLK